MYYSVSLDMSQVRRWIHGSAHRTALRIAALGAICMMHPSVATAQFAASNAPIVGGIEVLKIDDPADHWSSGVMLVGGQVVIIPRNMIIELPANFLTLADLFAQAPPECVARGESGLALADECINPGASPVATILANRTAAGDIIAGDVFIEKGQESVTGQVTFINHTDGYFRLNGRPNDDTTGVMVRLNDPDNRHTIQQGKGCNGGPNCSADPRFTNDPDNYTFTFTTGYPACIPSTQVGPFSNRADPGVSVSDANGQGDTFCPDNNRNGDPVNDSRFQAPIQLGDRLSADGNFEVIHGARFLSAHSIFVDKALTTSFDPNQPDYMTWDEVEWDVAGFQNQRLRMLMIGFTTLGTSQVDVYALDVDPATGMNHERILASTIGCEIAGGGGLPGAPGACIQLGIPPNNFGIFRIRYDVDFVDFLQNPPGEPVRMKLSPCHHLGFANLAEIGQQSPCVPPYTMEQEFSVVSPITRELIGRSRHKALAPPGVVAFDINGNEAPWGEYLTPVGVGHAEFVEINLDALATPFIFSGEPWLLDRRLGPAGCDGPCETTPQPLDPFPYSGLDPRTQAGSPGVPFGARNRILSSLGGPATVVLDWPPADPPEIAASLGVTVTRATQKQDAAATYIDVWASGDAGGTCVVNGTGIPPTPMIGDGAGNFFAHVTMANSVTPPASITVTDTTTGSTDQHLLVDEVFITEATFDVDLSTLTIKGDSSREDGSASLATADGTGLVGGLAEIVGLQVPPQQIAIGSSLGGALVLPVTVRPSVGLPVAAAGPDQIVTAGDTVLLDGTASTGLIDTITWTQTGGTPTVTLAPDPSDPTNTALRTFTFPAGDSMLTFTVTATSGAGSTSDTMTVTNAVVADAGPNQTFTAHPGATPVQLDAGASQGFGLSFAWAQTGGPAVTLSDANIADPTFIFPPGAVTVDLQVTVTGPGGAGVASVSVTSLLPEAPVANAGVDLFVGVNDPVQLDGTGSTGVIGSYFWERIGAGDPITLSDPTVANPTFVFPATTQIIVLQLTVSGPGGASVDTVSVTALAAPIADAGPDQSVVTGDLVTLQGGNSIGDIDTYEWVQVGGTLVVLGQLGPLGFELFDGDLTNPARVFFFGNVPEILEFQLTVTGPGGASTDNILVTAASPFNPDTLAVDRAEYKENKGKWRIEGTSSTAGPGHVVTAYLGAPLTGTPIGSAGVDAIGDWQIQTADNSPADPTQGGPQTISLVTTLGGVLEGEPFDIK